MLNNDHCFSNDSSQLCSVFNFNKMNMCRGF